LPHHTPTNILGVWGFSSRFSRHTDKGHSPDAQSLQLMNTITERHAHCADTERKCSNGTEIDCTDTMYALGQVQSSVLEGEELSAVNELLPSLGQDSLVSSSYISSYQKIVVNDQVIYSQLIKRVKRRNTYTVAYTDFRNPCQVLYGTVRKLMTYLHDLHVAIIQQLKVEVFHSPKFGLPPRADTFVASSYL